MVSFSCEACGDVLTKKKLDPHRNRCSGATFTCIDCMVHFPGTQYRSHTSCMTEDQKYQGALYKESNKKAKTHNKRTVSGMAQPAYVEDFDEWRDYQGPTDDERSPAEPLPEAPTPPAAADENEVNVFDYMVATGQTPNASDMNLGLVPDDKDSQSLVRYEGKADDYLDPASFLDEEIEYGSGPFETPAASKERRRRDADAKTDKKRKRLHVDTRDQVMTDAPPVLSSGLTGGLGRLMRPQLPPSPNESGADATPASPLKKSKSKHTKGGQVSNSIFGMIAGSSKSKTKAKKPKSKKRSSSEKSPKMIEYRPNSKDGKKEDGQGGELILFQPDAHALFSYVNKGSDSERGCSMNKALKRFHRDRKASGEKISKAAAEKELWRSLRLRKNDAGEIVLFAIE